MHQIQDWFACEVKGFDPLKVMDRKGSPQV